MTYSVIFWLALGLAVSAGLIAGVFATFSDFVMRGLHASAAAGGIESMQMINRVIYRSLFMVLFIGLALVSVGIVFYGLIFGFGSATVPLVLGGLVYVIGVFLVTGFFNVPMNNKLDGLDPNSTVAAHYWDQYVRNWVRWNHVRSIASTMTAALFIVGVVQLGNG